MGALILQTAIGAPVTAVAGTFMLFALFPSLTTHIVARDALGDVELKRTFAVGPVPAAIAIIFTSFGWNSFVTLALVLGLDFGFIKYLCGWSTRLSACVIITRFVVSVLLGLVLFGLSTILLTAPF